MNSIVPHRTKSAYLSGSKRLPPLQSSAGGYIRGWRNGGSIRQYVIFNYLTNAASLSVSFWESYQRSVLVLIYFPFFLIWRDIFGIFALSPFPNACFWSRDLNCVSWPFPVCRLCFHFNVWPNAMDFLKLVGGVSFKPFMRNVHICLLFGQLKHSFITQNEGR